MLILGISPRPEATTDRAKVLPVQYREDGLERVPPLLLGLSNAGNVNIGQVLADALCEEFRNARSIAHFTCAEDSREKSLLREVTLQIEDEM
jgi:hypothetical protein